MTTAKHTPGPWRADRRSILSGEGLTLRCLAEVLSGATDSPEEADANQTLIAAAPELLSALRALLAAQEALNDTGYDIAACQQNDRAEAAAVALLARLDGVAAGKPGSASLPGAV